MSRMPGLMASKAARMARSCNCAVARIAAISSSLLITMIWSTRSVASTNFALPSLPRLR
jgi:hypothetical protein